MGTTVHLTNRPVRKRKKPKEGDRKVVKGVTYERRQRMYNGIRMVSNGRPLWEWIEVEDTDND